MDIPSTPDQIAALITSLGEQILAQRAVIATAEAQLAHLYADAARVSDITALTTMPAGTSPERARSLARLSLQLELSAMTRTPERTVQRRINESEVLVSQLPDTLAALATGTISAGHARVIVDQLADVDPADRTEFETRILPIAKTHTAAQLQHTARKLREQLHPTTIAVRHHRAKHERHVTLTPAADGMSWLSILTTAPIATAAYNRLQALTAGAKHRGDARTRAQLMTDNAQSLLLFGTTASSGAPVPMAPAAPVTTAPAVTDTDDEIPIWAATTTPPAITTPPITATPPTTASPPRAAEHEVPTAPPVNPPELAPLPTIEEITEGIVPTVHLTVPVLTLLCEGNDPGSLEGYGPIDPETAARLTVNAMSFTRILTHPESGAVLSVGRDRYTPPADLARALAIRDTHCRAPGCNRLAKGCDLDHTVPWSAGGETSAGNLAHLCPKHHHVKHDTNWALAPAPNGTLHWTSPSGETFTTEPDPPDWYPLAPLPPPPRTTDTGP